MLKRARTVLAAAGAMMIAGSAVAAPPTPVYLNKAGASDLYEKTSSRIVLGSTHDEKVRRFATMMVRDHSDSTAKVKAAALRSGAHPRPPALNAMQTRMVADLRRAHGSQRDRIYIDQQRQAHAMALALHQEYAATGSAPALRRTASQIVPVVQHHIDMLSDMRR